MKQFFLPIYMILTGTINLNQNGPGIINLKERLHIPENFRTEALSSDGLVSYSGHSLGGILPLCRDAVSVFYRSHPYQLRYVNMRLFCFHVEKN